MQYDPRQIREVQKAGRLRSVEPWIIPRDLVGETCVVAANGPSLREMKDLHRTLDAAEIIVVNEAYQVFPHAAILYSADAKWWIWHDAVPGWRGMRVTQDKEAAVYYGLTWIPSANGRGLSTDPGLIHQGMNSAAQAMNIASLRGCSKIILLGFDHDQETAVKHRDGTVSNFKRLNELVWPRFKESADELGIDIVNCTPGSKMCCFRKSTLKAEV